MTEPIPRPARPNPKSTVARPPLRKKPQPVRLADLHPDLLETAKILAEIELRRIRQCLPESEPLVVQPVDWHRVGDVLVRRNYPSGPGAAASPHPPVQDSSSTRSASRNRSTSPFAD
jgi:hypothetical protein